MPTLYIALGSNIFPRIQFLRKGIQALKKEKINISQASSLYLTSPVGFKNQPSFLNAVVWAYTKLSAQELLKLFKQIEKQTGRVPGKRFGPRTLDLDLLLYDRLRLISKKLILPHPRMTKRRFVLVPLLEISPKLKTLDGKEGKPYHFFLSKLTPIQKVKLYRKNWI